MSSQVLGLVGAGAVGPALALRLREAGWSVGGVASRRLESSQGAIEFIGEGRTEPTNAGAAIGADLLLIAVPDRAISPVAEEVAAAGTVKCGSLAIHFSGALSPEALAPLRSAGASVGSIHPLASFASRGSAADRVRDAWLFYEGDDPERVRAVATMIAPHVAPVSREAKALYHAGAAAACNLFVAMVDLGVRLLTATGIPRDDALVALLPLVEGTTGNLREVGLPAALTGPVARGDAETIDAHMEKMRELCPDLVEAYAAASRHAIRVGIEKGTLGPGEAEEIRKRLA